MSPNLLRVILRGFRFGLSAVALLPVLVHETLQGTAFVYGVLLSCFGTGALVNARLSERFRNETIACGSFLGFGISCAVLPLPEFAGLDLTPLNRFKEPDTSFNLNYRSGPMMVMVDYEIAHEDVPTFLAAMLQRRRIRDGAQQWVLLCDLEFPDHWSESYHVPTWGEYIRHNERRTNADAALADQLRSLHRGDGPPQVNRMIERLTAVQAANLSPRYVR